MTRSWRELSASFANSRGRCRKRRTSMPRPRVASSNPRLPPGPARKVEGLMSQIDLGRARLAEDRGAHPEQADHAQSDQCFSARPHIAPARLPRATGHTPPDRTASGRRHSRRPAAPGHGTPPGLRAGVRTRWRTLLESCWDGIAAAFGHRGQGPGRGSLPGSPRRTSPGRRGAPIRRWNHATVRSAPSDFEAISLSRDGLATVW